jgi:hypothetical protein
MMFVHLVLGGNWMKTPLRFAVRVAALFLLASGSVPVSAQSISGEYAGYFVCLPWGHVNFTMEVTTPEPGWLTARLDYSASLPPPVQPRGSRVRAQGTSVRGSLELGGWLDDKTNRFKLDWQNWGPRQKIDTPLLTYTFQTSIAGTYRTDKEAFDGILVHVSCGTFVATRRGRKLEAPATEIPRSFQDQQAPLRAYHAILDEVESGHRDRVLALAPTRRSSGGKSASLRCGAYFLYYDLNFMRKDPESTYLFLPRPGFPSIGYIREWPPYGYTVSFTPPDASVDWIDEVETVSYGVEPRRFVPHSRGRRIPRRDATPVPPADSFFHRTLTIKNRECGTGTSYVW